MSDSRALDSNDAGRLPIEVCENVIDMLYSVVLRDQVEHTRALHSCALVCRAWRIRWFTSDGRSAERLQSVLLIPPHQ